MASAVSSPIRYARSGDGTHIAYRVIGDGPVDLVFVPGFVSHVEVFFEMPYVADFFERLGRFARVLFFDKRGLGLSDRPPNATLEDHARDALAVLDHAGVERAAAFGLSEGGPASIMLAAAHPDRITSLVLAGTWARIVWAADYPIGAPPAAIEALRAWIVERWGEPVALKLFTGEYAGEERVRDWWARLLRSGTSPAGVDRLIDTWYEVDVRALLPSVQQPTLVMHRTEDVLASAAMARYLAEHIPGAVLRDVPGPHVPMAGHHDEYLDEVEEFLTGERHAPEPDRALATLLFTDIVGSTERAAQLGDRRWHDVLTEHDRIVRRQLERHRGREVKHLGDGFFLTFPGPAQAIRCAADVVEAVRPLGVEVRAGVHTGECELRGADLAGMAVHIGARVGAQAGPSEVLVSRTVRDLVVGSGLGFEDRGEHALKGVEGAWRLYALQR
jgi:pimeloyl-ACP methyl ester carboxylesterase